MKLNDTQRMILVLMAIALVVAFLFPPGAYIGADGMRRRTRAFSYGILYPASPEECDTTKWIVEMFGVLVVGGLLCLAVKSK